jgi:hypothetical protein
MAEPVHSPCIHLDQKLRWFGYRQEQGRKLYVFQCLGCGKAFTSIVPFPAKDATGPLESLTGIGSL